MNLAEPAELRYLNFADKVSQWPTHFRAPLTIQMNLSNKVFIQSRVVYDLFMMLGEVGGLRDFIVLFFSTFMTDISG